MGSLSQEIKIAGRNGATIPHEAIEKLKSSIKGDVLIKGEASEEVYRAAIHRYNKHFIQEAAIIVQVDNESDIAVALQFVQKWDIEMAIRCGGHSYSGASSTKGLVIDLAKMRKVTLSKEAGTATAQGGCKAVDVESILQAEGLSAVFGNINDTGIGGLTVGGGSGPLSGQYGMVVDNLLSARVVTADGSILEVSDESNPDLFWAIRGGGSNFGIVTEFTYRTHKQTDVYFGPIIFTPDKTELLLQKANELQDLVNNSEGKLLLYLLIKFEQGLPAQPIVLVYYDGPDEEKAKAIIKPVLDLGPVAVLPKIVPWASTTFENPLATGPPTHQGKSNNLLRMTEKFDAEAVQLLIKDLNVFHDKHGKALAPTKLIIELKSWTKILSVPHSATAVAIRRPGIETMIEAQYNEQLNVEQVRSEIRVFLDKVQATLEKKNPGIELDVNPNLAGGGEKLVNVFGENLPRLRELKKKYDPGNVFKTTEASGVIHEAFDIWIKENDGPVGRPFRGRKIR